MLAEKEAANRQEDDDQVEGEEEPLTDAPF
jgi:hypothetical protein